MPSLIVVGTNSYATTAQVETFFSTRISGKLWASISTTDLKERCLIEAYDHLVKFNYTTDPLTLSGEVYTATTWIIAAQAFEALTLYMLYADEDSVSRETLQLQGITKVELDKIKEEYSKPKKIYTLRSRNAYEEIRPYVLQYPTKVYSDI